MGEVAFQTDNLIMGNRAELEGRAISILCYDRQTVGSARSSSTVLGITLTESFRRRIVLQLYYKECNFIGETFVYYCRL